MIAVYPGSFDPPTVGHLDIVRRAAALCAELHVLVLVNPNKRPMFSAYARASMIRACIEDLPNVKVSSSSNALLDEFRALKVDAVIRGLRSMADFEREKPVADVFSQQCGIETLFLACAPRFSYVSSSLVCEMLNLNIPVDALVPAPILKRLMAERSK